MPKKRFVSGVVDPITIIGVLFLIITLSIGTYVVSDKKYNFNIFERAGIDGGLDTLSGNSSGQNKAVIKNTNDYDPQAGIKTKPKKREADDSDLGTEPQAPTQPSKPKFADGCDVNGTKLEVGARVVGGANIAGTNFKGTSGYATCDANLGWVDCLTCNDQNLTVLPIYIENELEAACSNSGKTWDGVSKTCNDSQTQANNTPITIGQQDANAPYISLSDTVRDEEVKKNNLAYQLQQVTINPKITTTNSNSLDGVNIGGGTSKKIQTADQYIKAISQDIVDKLLEEAISGWSTYTNPNNYNFNQNLFPNQKVTQKDRTPTIQQASYCGRSGLTQEQRDECTNIARVSAYNNPITSGYLQAYSPQNVMHNYDQMGYDSVSDCVEGEQTYMGKQLCNGYQITKNQVTSSVSLGTDIASVITLPVAAAYFAPKSLLTFGFKTFSGTMTVQQTKNAVVAQIEDPGFFKAQEDINPVGFWETFDPQTYLTDAGYQTAMAGLGWWNLSTVDDLIRAWGPTGNAILKQGARVKNTYVSGANLWFDAPYAVNTCSEVGYFTTDCAFAGGTAVADIIFGGVDVYQGQLTLNPIRAITETIDSVAPSFVNVNRLATNPFSEIQIPTRINTSPISLDYSLGGLDGQIGGWPTNFDNISTYIKNEPYLPNSNNGDILFSPYQQHLSAAEVNEIELTREQIENLTAIEIRNLNPTPKLAATYPDPEILSRIAIDVGEVGRTTTQISFQGFRNKAGQLQFPIQTRQIAIDKITTTTTTPVTTRIGNWFEGLTNPSLAQKYELAVRDRLIFNNGDYEYARTDLENIKKRFLEYDLNEDTMRAIDQKVLGKGPIAGYFDQLSFNIRTILFDARNQANPSINNIKDNIQTGPSIYDIDKKGLPKATKINISWLDTLNDFWGKDIVSPDGKLLPKLRTDPSNLKLEQQYKIALDSVEGFRANKHSLSELNMLDNAYRKAGLSKDTIDIIKKEISGQTWGDILATKETWLRLFYGYDFSEPVLSNGMYTKNITFSDLADDFITSPSASKLIKFTNTSSPVFVLIGTTYSGYEFWNHYISDETKQSISDFWNNLTLPIFNLSDKKVNDKGINILGKKVRDILPPVSTNPDSMSVAYEKLDVQNTNSLINHPTISTTGSNLNLNSTPDQYKLAVFLTGAVNDFYSLQQTADGRNQIIQTIQKSGLANLYPYINLSVYGGSGNVTADNKNTYALYIMSVAKLNNVTLNTKVTDFVGPDNVFSSWYGFKDDDKFQVTQCVMWQNLLAITYPELDIVYGYGFQNANDVRGHINNNNYSIIDGGKHFSSNLGDVQFFEFTDINNVQKGDTCVYGSGVGHMCTILDKYEHNGKLYFLISEANSPNGKLDGTPQTYIVDEAGFMNLVGLDGVLFLRSTTSYLNESLKNPSQIPDSFLLPIQDQSSTTTTQQQNDASKNYSNQLLAYADVGLGGKELPKTYVPPELIDVELDNIVEHGRVVLTKNAAEALAEFAKYAESQGYTLYVYSGYRSYNEQEQLHNENPKGSASAGNSQHQTGLAIDIYYVDINGVIKALPRRIIEKAPEFGLIHPVVDDPPHFLFIEDLGIDTTDFNVIAKSENDYLLLNEAIQEAQNQTSSSR